MKAMRIERTGEKQLLVTSTHGEDILHMVCWWLWKAVTVASIAGVCLAGEVSGWAQRLQEVRCQTKATLQITGDCALGCGGLSLTQCPYGNQYCSPFWDFLCGSQGSRTVILDASYLTLGGFPLFCSGQSFSVGASLKALLTFSFTSPYPNLQIEGYTYTPKRDLGFLYFVQKVRAESSALTYAECGPNSYQEDGCCNSSSASAEASASVQTSLVSASVSSSASASCSCNTECMDCTGPDEDSDPSCDPADCSSRRDYSAKWVSFGRSERVSYMEEMTGNISLKGSWVECGALAVRASAEAYGGLVIQVQPDPLGVPAIGENEYVWTGDVPAELGIDAAAMVHTWGWDGADTAWLASEVSFRTEPEIPTDYTKPGILTVARGSLLVAQSEVDGNMRDGLVYKSDRLPPRNSDFGKKRVLLASKQGPVDYAEVEVFYPADSKNHPPDGPPGWESPTYPCSPSVATETPNWFFYYCQAYSCRDIEYVNSDMSYACRTKAYIANSGSPSRGEWGVPLFILQERLDSCGRMRPLITQATYRIGEFMPWLDRLWVKGIHRFITLVEHERAHLDLWRMGIQVERGGANDRDHDWLHDDIEPQIGLDPCDRWSAAYPLANEFPYGDPDGDADALAEIIAYGRLLMAEALWRMDWAENGLQFGRPVSPFPWRYGSNNSNYPSRTDLLTNIPSTQYSHCQCPQVRR